MESKELYEIIGRTYAKLCEVSEKEGYWQRECEAAQERIRTLTAKYDKLYAEKEALRKELEKYGNMVRNDGDQSTGQETVSPDW